MEVEKKPLNPELLKIFGEEATISIFVSPKKSDVKPNSGVYPVLFMAKKPVDELQKFIDDVADLSKIICPRIWGEFDSFEIQSVIETCENES